LALYYDEELNLKEIGEVLGVSESRVSQLHSQCAARLRGVWESGERAKAVWGTATSWWGINAPGRSVVLQTVIECLPD
jgi:DNA-binding transcriptional regulator GbsR (MarR family)